MSAIFFHVRNICSHSFTPSLYVHIVLPHSALCSYSFTYRLYVHNLLSHSVYTFTFFHTPTICSQSSLTFSVYVHVVSHPDSMFTILFHIQYVHILSHPEYMFTIFFHIQCSHYFAPRLYVHNPLSHSVCSHPFTPRIYVHNLLSHSMFTLFRIPTICSKSSFTFSIC